MRLVTGGSGVSGEDRGWKERSVPSPYGGEAAGFQGVDGAMWFREGFDLPAGWEGKEGVLALGRKRDVDYT